GIRDFHVTGVQTCALPIYGRLRTLSVVVVDELRGRVAGVGGRGRAPGEGSLAGNRRRSLREVGEGVRVVGGRRVVRCRGLLEAQVGRASCRGRRSLALV